MADLDDLYGRVIVPRRVGHGEQGRRQRSVQTLDSASASSLAHLMRLVKTDAMGSLLGATVPILWLVGEDGRVRYAWEELWETVPGPSDPRLLPAGPHPRRLRDLPERYFRLGHPSLVPGHRGRIGGELMWDREKAKWFLTNRSGRYGAVPELRTPAHLENAARLFHRHHIPVVARFGDGP